MTAARKYIWARISKQGLRNEAPSKLAKEMKLRIGIGVRISAQTLSGFSTFMLFLSTSMQIPGHYFKIKPRFPWRYYTAFAFRKKRADELGQESFLVPFASQKMYKFKRSELLFWLFLWVWNFVFHIVGGS
jgi:hypothetical protein